MRRRTDDRSTGSAAREDMIGVSVRGLRKSYGPGSRIVALDDLTLDFPAGRCTVLLGPSGCGKTTVLRSIAGLVTPDAGRIAIEGEVAFDGRTGIDVPPEKRRLGMVFQSYALWPHLDVAKNITYPLANSGLSKSEIATKAEEMLEWIGLGGMGDRFIHELSGGQQQRVSLGRAMIGSPRAILFDEPLSNLDARLRERMRMELLALRERAPFTSIYVTHDQLEAMTLGDRVVVMRAGTVEQVGTPEEVYKRPRTRFAADFMGIPNLIEGAVSEVVGSKVAVDTPLGTLPAAGWRTDWSAGSRCTIAVRPTSLQLRTGDERAGRPGRVVRSVFQGVTSVHIVDIGGIEIAVESFEESRLAAGADVVVSPAAGAVFAVLDD